MPCLTLPWSDCRAGVRSPTVMIRRRSGVENSDIRHFHTFAAYEARGDIARRDGRTAAAILSRMRDPAFHAVPARLAGEVKPT